ncbi:hypothetical protein [Neptunomonas qingdaonensis]|uniref:Uncharacterized protein n=1 Tax=Neptunomonas qingdaonensis TaxID=1045558 RepID=A0A1I2SAL8_9GAMM|nr:hypothetical protein [Neptunomonas qingdaonensis]SFG48719.1 hypothetical protein SAMN05216175_107147 [Neptunomonas qingdaonensis]
MMISEILELRSGQVAYISSLMAGFSLSIAVQIIRGKDQRLVATANYLLFIVTTLLFLIALYVDVSISLRLVGIEDFCDDALIQIENIRNLSTSAATSAFLLFVLSIGVLGWLKSNRTGIISTLMVLLTLATIIVAKNMISNLDF